MSRFWQDARLALRGFRRSPTFAVTAILILGVGIGMAAAMWTVFNAVLLRPLPVQDADRIVLLRALDQSGVGIGFEMRQLDEIRRSSRTMRDVAGIVHWTGPSGARFLDGDHPIRLAQMYVTGNLFEVLGARPALGRLLLPSDDSTSRVAMASAVREQTRDIGVRMALGATPGRVRADVLRRAMLLCLAGVVVGIGLALAASRVIASLLFDVSPTDPLALIGACVLLLAVAAIAAYVPAHHASRVDPARALQAD